MLYSPKWQYKADAFSLESLIAWLEGQPADKAYLYKSPRQCLLAQYFTACGFEDVRVGEISFMHGDCTAMLPAHFNDVAFGTGTSWEPTFGAALDRARALQGTGR